MRWTKKELGLKELLFFTQVKGLFSDPSPILNRPQLIGPFGPGTKPVELFLHRTLPRLYPLATQLYKLLGVNACIDINGIPTRCACSSLFETFKVLTPSLCALTQQATHLVRRQSSLVSLPPCLRFSPLPLYSYFFSSVFSVVHPPTAVLSVLRANTSSDLLAAWIRSDPSPCSIAQFFGCVFLAALLLYPIYLFLFSFVSFSFFCVSFAALLPTQRYYLPLSRVDYFEPSSVTPIGCTDPAISRHRSASCVANLRLHRLHQIASAPIPAQPQQLHQSRRVHVSISRSKKK